MPKTKRVKTNAKAKTIKKESHLKLVPNKDIKRVVKSDAAQNEFKQQQRPPHPFSRFMQVQQPANTSSFVKKINLRVSRRRAG